MESDSKADPESEAQASGSTQVGTLDTSGFEVTADRLEQLMKSMEVLLSDVEQLRSHCSHQATELMSAAVELRHQQDELKESYSELAREMQEVMDTVDDLFSTKSAFETKEKQTQKLNRQLWGTESVWQTLFLIEKKTKTVGGGVWDVCIKIWTGWVWKQAEMLRFSLL